MKKLIIFFAILMSVAAVSAQKISGKWNGSINIHGKQSSIVFNISRTSKEGFTSTMDNPDQKVYGMETSYTTFKDSVLTIQIENAEIEYVGVLNFERKFIGTLKQSGELFPLELTDSNTAKKNMVNATKGKDQSFTYVFKPENFDML